MNSLILQILQFNPICVFTVFYACHYDALYKTYTSDTSFTAVVKAHRSNATYNSESIRLGLGSSEYLGSQVEVPCSLSSEENTFNFIRYFIIAAKV